MSNKFTRKGVSRHFEIFDILFGKQTVNGAFEMIHVVIRIQKYLVPNQVKVRLKQLARLGTIWDTLALGVFR